MRLWRCGEQLLAGEFFGTSPWPNDNQIINGQVPEYSRKPMAAPPPESDNT